MKRNNLAPRAEYLYVHELKEFTEIATIIKVNERTVRTWAKRDNWQQKRDDYLRSKEALKHELIDFTRYLLRDVSGTLMAGEEPSKTKSDLLKSFRRVLLPDSEFEPAPPTPEDEKPLQDPLEAVRQFLRL